VCFLTLGFNVIQRLLQTTGDWRKLHNELHNLYSSPYIITVIKSRTMRRVKHEALFEEKKSLG
jgi:hypothetical protein